MAENIAPKPLPRTWASYALGSLGIPPNILSEGRSIGFIWSRGRLLGLNLQSTSTNAKLISPPDHERGRSVAVVLCFPHISVKNQLFRDSGTHVSCSSSDGRSHGAMRAVPRGPSRTARSGEADGPLHPEKQGEQPTPQASVRPRQHSYTPQCV